MIAKDDWQEIDQHIEKIVARLRLHKKIMDEVSRRLKTLHSDVNTALESDERAIINCQNALFNHEERIAKLENRQGLASTPMTLREKSMQNYKKGT